MTEPEPDTPSRCDLAELDVRPILDGGDDPLDTILAELGTLQAGSALHILAPFRPGPLLTLLSGQGHAVHDAELSEGIWSVLVSIDGAGPIEDLRELPPPEPLEAVLTSTVDGGPYVARLPRYPRLLETQLQRRGLTWNSRELPDGSALLWVAP